MNDEFLKKLQSGSFTEEEYAVFSKDVHSSLETLKQENPQEYLKVIRTLTDFAKELHRAM